MSNKKSKKKSSTSVPGVSGIRWAFGSIFIANALIILIIKITLDAVVSEDGLGWNFMVGIDSINVGKPSMIGYDLWVFYLDQFTNILIILVLPLSLIIWALTWCIRLQTVEPYVINNFTNITNQVSEAKSDEIIANENDVIALTAEKKAMKLLKINLMLKEMLKDNHKYLNKNKLTKQLEKTIAYTNKPKVKKARKVYSKVSKKEILESLYVTYNVEMTKKDIKAVLNDTFEIMKKNLFKVDSEITIAGFGKFVTVTKPERTSINPLTQEKITIPAHKVVTFKPAKKIKEIMN